MSDSKKIVRKYKDIRLDYVFDSDIMNDEPEAVAAFKEIINNKLSRADQIIFLLYTDCGSYRELGKQLQVSHMTARRDVLRIREILLQEYAKMKDKL